MILVYSDLFTENNFFGAKKHLFWTGIFFFLPLIELVIKTWLFETLMLFILDGREWSELKIPTSKFTKECQMSFWGMMFVWPGRKSDAQPRVQGQRECRLTMRKLAQSNIAVEIWIWLQHYYCFKVDAVYFFGQKFWCERGAVKLEKQVFYVHSWEEIFPIASVMCQLPCFYPLPTLRHYAMRQQWGTGPYKGTWNSSLQFFCYFWSNDQMNPENILYGISLWLFVPFSYRIIFYMILYTVVV